MRPPQREKEPPHTSQLICRYFPGNVVLQADPAVEITYFKIEFNLKKGTLLAERLMGGQYELASIDKENVKLL
jgi:hypothetical protein